MTRFARAKGSKSSNLKDPEDSTPWEVMKEQLLKAKAENEDSKKRQEAEQQRIENYENFLKERKVEKRKAEWCDFPDVVKAQQNDYSEIKKKKNKRELISTTENDVISEQSVSTNKSKKKKSKNKFEQNKTTSKCNNDVSQDLKEVHQKPSFSQNTETQTGLTNETLKASAKETKKNKNKNKNNQNIANTDQEQHSNKSTQAGNVQTKKFKKHGDQPVRRKEITEKSFKIIINGKDIELVRFDGFPIMKKDAERLQELKNSMLKKGIPKSEVQRTMKLERRRAEKALARVKRDVCYNCRKGGHNLSDCPDLRSNIPGVDTADGVCFKCGSTEHRQNECKVQQDKEFRFATCFICREPGHLARQCPDNPKGLYPNGGCCKLCGDVTHLRKDCPTVMEKKESTSIKLSTLDGAENIEDIGHAAPAPVVQDTVKKPKKIKF